MPHHTTLHLISHNSLISGMLYAIEKRKVLDVTVTLSAPKVVIPEAGSFDTDGPLIVADLGRLVLTTQVMGY